MNEENQNELAHSAKGSIWDKHKYVKKIMGKSGNFVYFYANSYTKGRTMSDIADWAKSNYGKALNSIKEWSKSASAKLNAEKKKNKNKKNKNKGVSGDTVYAYDPKTNQIIKKKKEETKKVETSTSSAQTELEPLKTATKKKDKKNKGKKGSSKKSSSSSTDTIETNTPVEGSTEDLANRVIRGEFGNGQARKNALGDRYSEVQALVNKIWKEKYAKHSAIDNDYLEHHGIFGMKWGVRRYQNKDGSLTSLGKRRLNGSGYTDSDGNVLKGREADARAKVHANVAGDYVNVAAGLGASSKMNNKLADMSQRSHQRTKDKIKRGIDVSNMSDEELNKAINRMNLEQRYKNLKADDVDSGKIYAEDVLRLAGDVAALGVSAATIAIAIHQLKSKD